MKKYVSRRKFLKFGLASSALPLTGMSMSLSSSSVKRYNYKRSIIIDNLASPGLFNVPGRLDNPLTDEMLSNSRKSGITAVNVTVSAGGNEAFKNTVSSLGYWEKELIDHPDYLTKITSVEDIYRTKKEKKLGLIFGFQDTTMFEDKLEHIDTFYNLGMRITQLTYNLRNLVGDGCLFPNAGGLTDFGKSVVEKLNDKQILIDLSHCSTQTTREGIIHSKSPISITHSGCKSVYDHPRSKRDEELKMMADNGGVLGVYMMPFLNAKGQATSDHLMDHIEYAINVCGEDHVAIGSDLSITPHVVDDEYIASHTKFAQIRNAAGIAAPREDEFFFVKDMNSALRMKMIGDKLQKAGHSAKRIEKILGGNWMRLFSEVWKK